MDKTKAVHLSVGDEVLNDHLDEVKKHYESEVNQYYTVISDQRIREIVRDELRKIDMEKMYND